MLKKNKKLKVACIQMNSQDSLQKNILFAKKKIYYASKKGAKLILLPENCFLISENTKKLIENTYSEIMHPGINEIKKIAKNKKLFIIIGSVNIKEKRNIYNRSILIDNKGNIKGRYNKIHLFSANLLEDSDSIDLEDEIKFSLYEKAAANNSYSSKELFKIYQKFL